MSYGYRLLSCTPQPATPCAFIPRLVTDKTTSSDPVVPEFSVLISLYDREKPEFLDECLHSVAEQSWPAAEVVMVLDGPVNDALMAVVRKWEHDLPLLVLPLPQNVGLGEALAHGMRHCHFELVVRADTDDINQPWRFERQVAFLQQNPHLDLCGSCMWEVDPATGQPLSRKTVPQTDAAIMAMLPYRNPFNHPAMALRRQKVLDCGNYASLPQAEDYYLWLRMLAGGCRGWNLQDDLVLARTGAGMLQRRRGLQYAKTEYRLYRIKRQLHVGNPVSAAAVFLARALSRMLPAALLGPLYRRLRRN